MAQRNVVDDANIIDDVVICDKGISMLDYVRAGIRVTRPEEQLCGLSYLFGGLTSEVVWVVQSLLD